MKLFALLIALSMTLFGCGKANDASAEESASTEESSEAAEESGDTAGGGSPCDNATKCCEAYVAAVGGGISVEQACAGIAAASQAGAAGNQSCNTMISSWRQALTAAGKDVPGACAE